MIFVNNWFDMVYNWFMVYNCFMVYNWFDMGYNWFDVINCLDRDVINGIEMVEIGKIR